MLASLRELNRRFLGPRRRAGRPPEAAGGSGRHHRAPVGGAALRGGRLSLRAVRSSLSRRRALARASRRSMAHRRRGGGPAGCRGLRASRALLRVASRLDAATRRAAAARHGRADGGGISRREPRSRLPALAAGEAANLAARWCTSTFYWNALAGRGARTRFRRLRRVQLFGLQLGAARLLP